MKILDSFGKQLDAAASPGEPMNPYESPKTPPTPQPRPESTGPYGRAILVALGQQLPLIVLAALLVDGGQSLKALAGLLVISWFATLAVMVMRPDRPTKFHLFAVKYSF